VNDFEAWLQECYRSRPYGVSDSGNRLDAEDAVQERSCGRGSSGTRSSRSRVSGRGSTGRGEHLHVETSPGDSHRDRRSGGETLADVAANDDFAGRIALSHDVMSA